VNRMSRPCGGAGGFDDYVEWWAWYLEVRGINNNINRVFYAPI
jgi:hypothetical protein